MPITIKITKPHIKTICDSYGDKLLEFSVGTLLDRIILDLWNEISRYWGYHVVIGYYGKKYDGYRMMTKDEFDSNKFVKYYSEIGGLLWIEYDGECDEYDENRENYKKGIIGHLVIDDLCVIYNSVKARYCITCCINKEHKNKIILVFGGGGLHEYHQLELIKAKPIYKSDMVSLFIPDIK